MWEKISSLEHHSAERLAERRKRGHYRVLLIQAFLLCILFAVFVWGLWQAPVRISHVVVYGGDQEIAKIANAGIQGTYLGVIPRDSTFFLPEARIRADIVAAYPDVAAISIFRNGLTGISIKVSDRVSVARWCGATPPDLIGTSTVTVDAAQCYLFDASGFLYQTNDPVTPINSFLVYEPLGLGEGTVSPVGKVLPHADEFPAVFDFARRLSTFGSPATMIVLRGDEVDIYVKSGTRVTFVLGNEQYAATALVSAGKGIDLKKGQLEYIDLRFDGKVYLKKK